MIDEVAGRGEGEWEREAVPYGQGIRPTMGALRRSTCVTLLERLVNLTFVWD